MTLKATVAAGFSAAAAVSICDILLKMAPLRDFVTTYDVLFLFAMILFY